MPPTPFQEYSYDTGKVTLNHAEVPHTGPSLVLLHGGSARWQSFESIIPALADRWHIYAPDFRGHGGSDWVPGGYRLQDFASDIAIFLQRCVGEPAYLFGHSLGGDVALLVAAQHPELVRAVMVGDSTLTSASSIAGLRASRERLMAWRDLAGGRLTLPEVISALKQSPMEALDGTSNRPLRDVLGEDSPYFPWMAINLAQHDPEMLTMLIERPEVVTAGFEMDLLLPAIQCPTLLLQADPARGAAMPDDDVRCALALTPHATHVRLDGVSHTLHNERPDTVIEAITTFLGSV